MAKEILVRFSRAVTLIVPDDMEEDTIVEKAVERHNEADLDDMYATEDDVTAVEIVATGLGDDQLNY